MPGPERNGERPRGTPGPAAGIAYPCTESACSNTVILHASLDAQNRPSTCGVGCAGEEPQALVRAGQVPTTGLHGHCSASEGKGEPAVHCSSITPQPSDFFNIPKNLKKGERREAGGREGRLRPPGGTSSPGPRSTQEAGHTGHTAPSMKPKSSMKRAVHLHVAEASLGEMTPQSFQNESPQTWSLPSLVTPRSTFHPPAVSPSLLPPWLEAGRPGWFAWHEEREQTGKAEPQEEVTTAWPPCEAPSQVGSGSSASHIALCPRSMANIGQESRDHTDMGPPTAMTESPLGPSGSTFHQRPGLKAGQGLHKPQGSS